MVFVRIWAEFMLTIAWAYGFSEAGSDRADCAQDTIDGFPVQQGKPDPLSLGGVP